MSSSLKHVVCHCCIAEKLCFTKRQDVGNGSRLSVFLWQPGIFHLDFNPESMEILKLSQTWFWSLNAKSQLLERPDKGD